MDIDDLKRRTAPRVQAIVVRDGRVLMAHHSDGADDPGIWCLPGGAQEPGETPEEGALRELREEAGVDGWIVRRIGVGLDAEGSIDTYTFLVDIENQEPMLGHDPELAGETAILVDLAWLPLWEIPERDRVFLWRAGLTGVPGFLEEITSWGDEVSYPRTQLR